MRIAQWYILQKSISISVLKDGTVESAHVGLQAFAHRQLYVLGAVAQVRCLGRF